jgi:hypothetical protein
MEVNKDCRMLARTYVYIHIWTTLNHVAHWTNEATKSFYVSAYIHWLQQANNPCINASLYPHPTSAARADHVEKSDPFPCSCRPGHVRACRPCTRHIVCFQVVKCVRTDPFLCVIDLCGTAYKFSLLILLVVFFERIRSDYSHPEHPK